MLAFVAQCRLLQLLGRDPLAMQLGHEVIPPVLELAAHRLVKELHRFIPEGIALSLALGPGRDAAAGLGSPVSALAGAGWLYEGCCAPKGDIFPDVKESIVSLIYVI